MEKYFTDEFIDNLPDDKILALNSICSEFRKFDNEAAQRINYIEHYFKALAIFKAYASTKDYPLSEIQPGSDPNQNINKFVLSYTNKKQRQANCFILFILNNKQENMQIDFNQCLPMYFLMMIFLRYKN